MSILDKYFDGQGYVPVSWDTYSELSRDKEELEMERHLHPKLVEGGEGCWVLYVPKSEEARASWLIKEWREEMLDNMERGGHDLTGHGPGSGIRK